MRPSLYCCITDSSGLLEIYNWIKNLSRLSIKPVINVTVKAIIMRVVVVVIGQGDTRKETFWFDVYEGFMNRMFYVMFKRKRISQGHGLNMSSHSYVVGIKSDSFSNIPSFCTGSLIKPLYVLTAGHCIHLQLNIEASG
ncbi:uncharacterized protein LOC126905807 [Daktulosphaira vitifoliae]|uniref:uncharacterized protein LOC126905807 n=1 Tax=Daktulosphaira vitifoliae TaxID=58002 RepID=UPI0021AA5A9B|nr:uncharacterized protein LOC126905807 [Daktulosphaira vitifoliae]